MGIEDPLDRQVGGSHYKNFEIQPIEFITRNEFTFITGCIIKYAVRAEVKGPLKREQDLNKIIHYCEILLDFDRRTKCGLVNESGKR